MLPEIQAMSHCPDFRAIGIHCNLKLLAGVQWNCQPGTQFGTSFFSARTLWVAVKLGAMCADQVESPVALSARQQSLRDQAPTGEAPEQQYEACHSAWQGNAPRNQLRQEGNQGGKGSHTV